MWKTVSILPMKGSAGGEMAGENALCSLPAKLPLGVSLKIDSRAAAFIFNELNIKKCKSNIRGSY